MVGKIGILLSNMIAAIRKLLRMSSFAITDVIDCAGTSGSYYVRLKNSRKMLPFVAEVVIFFIALVDSGRWLVQWSLASINIVQLFT